MNTRLKIVLFLLFNAAAAGVLRRKSTESPATKASRELVDVSSAEPAKPARKLFYVLDKSKVTDKKKEGSLLAGKSPVFVKSPPKARKLEKTRVSQTKRPFARKARLRATKELKKSVSPKKSLQTESFVVPRPHTKGGRKLLEGDKEDADSNKLQSIPLLLFGDYEIIIEKRSTDSE